MKNIDFEKASFTSSIFFYFNRSFRLANGFKYFEIIRGIDRYSWVKLRNEYVTDQSKNEQLNCVSKSFWLRSGARTEPAR